jgi:DnaK suppressor protein
VAADVTAARVVERLSDVELVQLQHISSALTRLEEGTYGACVVCGHDIAEARLAAIPEADRCSRCTDSMRSTRPRDEPRGNVGERTN